MIMFIGDTEVMLEYRRGQSSVADRLHSEHTQ